MLQSCDMLQLLRGSLVRMVNRGGVLTYDQVAGDCGSRCIFYCELNSNTGAALGNISRIQCLSGRPIPSSICYRQDRLHKSMGLRRRMDLL